MNKSGIHLKKSHEGLLHRELGVAEGQAIPEKKLRAAENSDDPAMRKRAVFAENAKHWRHGGKKRGIGHKINALRKSNG